MLDLISTPSSGVDETLLALYNAHALNGRRVSAQRLMRHFAVHTELVDVQEVLVSLESSAFVDDDGKSNYGLLPAGVSFMRRNRPRHQRLNVY